MAFTTKTFTAGQLLKALQANAPATVTLKERKQKENAAKKWRAGVGYVDCKLSIDPTDERAYAASVYARGVRVVRGPPDPADENKGFDRKNTKEAIVIVSSNHSGGYGEMIQLFNNERDRQLTEMEDKGQIRGYKDKKMWPMSNGHYSDQARAEFAGKPFPDPVDKDKTDRRINLVMDFSTFPDVQYIPVEKRGKVCTVVKDFKTGRLNEATGEIEYELYTVDGRPVDETNAHKVFTSGTILEEVYVAFTTTSKSQFGVSTKQIVQEVVVNTRVNSNFGKIERVDNADLLERIRKLQLEKQGGGAASGAPAGATGTPADGAPADAGTTTTNAEPTGDAGDNNDNAEPTPPQPEVVIDDGISAALDDL